MELSSIGDQVFAVESITKKRVRKVRGGTCAPFNLRTNLSPCVCFLVSRGALCPVQHRLPSSYATKLGYAVSQLFTQMRCSNNLCFELTAPKF